MKRTKQIDIKRALALAGTFSFLSSCAKSCLLPFLTLYFRQLGLSPAMTGIVMGTKYFITLLWRPVASMLAKHYNKRRMVINCSLVFSAAAALLLLLVPSTDVSGAETGTCNTSHRNAAHVIANLSSFNNTDTGNSSDVTISILRKPKNGSIVYSTISSVVTPVRHKRSEFMSQQPEGNKRGSFGFLGSLKEMDIHNQLFLMILFIVSVWEFVSAPLEWTVDDGLYEYLDFADASDRYSSSEVWGSLGAACGVGGTGVLVSQLSCLIAGHTNRRAVHFYCYAVLAALTLPVAAYLPLYLNKKRDRANGLLKAAQLVYGSPRALLCTFTILLVGILTSAVDNFLLWQMQDHGSSELHMGLTLSLSLLSQTAFPLLAGRVSKLLSPGRVLVVGAASLGLQCFYYSFLWGAWAALPAQVLSCFSGGALWWAVTIQCEDVATPGAERSVRRVYNSLCLQLGSGLGSFVGGFVVQRFGLVWLYRGGAIGLMAWCMCLPLLQWKAPHQRRINYSRLLAADASEASDSESEQERDWLDKAMEDDRGKNNYGRRMSP
ncbi:major facilitator superfamily domain-containing protein 6-like [Melanotaenia boesemani]|uniref:major facilitator superfamily domain-containing protein 6-like n=1 Tax=Melanotaenia boesemani TaxID=1250792 RepID=UPI001C05D849|nr:major facilitator superfamily domain-containing protein 6-like [Melanotaenia boesemani]XP_041832537.1 major facilitator superfamily domain-containing protein 6-like [Melanotaenia boesemani]